MHRSKFTATLFVLLISLLSAPFSAVAQISFTKHVIDPGLSGAYWVRGADMDRDGDLDLVTAASGSIDWFENDGRGGFSRHSVGGFDGVWQVYAADVDGDGDMDVCGASSTLMEVAWWENTGGFTKHSLGPLQNAESVFAADLDGDGDLEILAAGWGDNAITYWENRGGNFVRHDIDTDLTGAHSVYAADFDRDGDIDVVGAGSGSVAWYRNDGRGNFSGPNRIGGEGALCVFAADVDRNGTMDILSTGRSTENVNFFPNSGGGSFSQQVIASGFGNSWTVHAADVDGDGVPDVMSGGLYNHKVVVWLNRGGSFGEQVVDENVGEIRSVFGGDFDRDGDADIAVAIRNPGQLVWYEVRGGGGVGSQPQLTVTSPNGGESWDGGSVHDITWTSQNFAGNVKIEFSADGGGSWTTVVASTSNSGSYSWTVPNSVSNQCLVRISDAADGVPSDVSDGGFSIVEVALPSITVLRPNGGERILQGSTYSIQWSSSGSIAAVKVEVSLDGGASWTVIESSTANDGETLWNVPNGLSQNCLIRVSDAADGVPSDQSDGTFAIVEGGPAGFALSFDGTDDGAVILDSPLLSGGTGKSITVEVWVKLEDASRHNPVVTKFLDTSWKEWGIEVDEGHMVVDIENNGDNWAVVGGSVSSGQWKHLAFTFDNARDAVQLYLDGAPVGNPAVQPKDMPDTATPVALGYHYGNYRTKGVLDELRIWNYARSQTEIQTEMNRLLQGNEPGLIGYWRFDEGSGQRSADLTGNGNTVLLGTSTASESSDPAWVASDAPLSAVPFVQVQLPNGGERWEVGSSQEIRWRGSASIANVKLEFSGDRGRSWTAVVGSTPNDGSYIWQVPEAASDSCLIRVSDAADGDPWDVSDGLFAIVPPPPPTVRVISPNGGESWAEGSSQMILWASLGSLAEVKLEFSADGGTSWTTLASSVPNTGTYSWTVSGGPSSRCLIRVSDGVDGDPWDVSDGFFTITALGQGGYALQFDGSNDVARIPDNALLSGGPGKSLTVETWVNLQSVSGDHPIVTKFLDTNWKDWGVQVQGGAVVVDIENNGDNWFYGAGTVSPGVWTHLAFTVDNARKMVRIYVNGVEAGSGASLGKDMPDTPAPVLLAGHQYNGRYTAGIMDELRIWNYARSQAEIQNDMNRLLVGNEPGLIGYWRFDEGSGQRSADLTGNGNTVLLGTSTASESSDPAWVASDAPLSAVPFVQVQSPNGGETWVSGTSREIRWLSSGGISAVTIEFSSDGGATWTTVAAALANSGSYLWVVPDAESGNCRIRVSDAADGDPSDVSDRAFSITRVRAGYALSFDGRDDLAKIPDNDLLSGGRGKSITVEAWVKLNSVSGTNPVVTKFLDTEWKDWGLLVVDGQLLGVIENAGDNWEYAAGSVTANRWTHLAFTFDNATRAVRLFVDGVQAGRVTAPREMPDTGAPVVFGNNNYRPTYLAGSLEEVRIWNYARTEAELGGAMSRSLSGTEGGLIGYWHFDEGTGQIAADASGHGNAVQLGATTNAEASDPAWVISDAPLGGGLPKRAGSQSTQQDLPTEYRLEQNHPNPFNSETAIGYSLPQRSPVRLVIYDLLGREVRQLVNEEQEAGSYRVVWDGRDEKGEGVPSGIYVYRIETGSYTASKKLLLLK